MRVELTRFRVLPGKSERVDEWLRVLNERMPETLATLERTARDGANVVPAVIEAVKAYVTLGEISDVLRKVFGTYREDGRF